MRRFTAAVLLTLMTVGCSGGPTLGEYAEAGETLIATMNRAIDDLDAELEATVPTPEFLQAYFEAKAAARHEFLDGFEDLEPPEDAVEMHTVALNLITELTAAEEALAQWVADLESSDELSMMWDTPEARAMEAIDQEAIALCQAAQAELDATADREVFVDYPWISPELQEVVSVLLGCTAEERGRSS